MASRYRLGALAAVLFALAACAAAAENLLVNPGFDGSIAGWQVRGADTAYNPLDSGGVAGSGSGRTFEGESIHQCVAIQGGRVFDFAASAFIPPGQTRSAPAIAGVRFGASCAAADGLSFSVGVSSAVVGSWTRLAGRAYAPPQARFAELSLAIGKAGPGDVLFGLFDDALLAESSDGCSPVWAYPLLTTTPGPRTGMAMAFDAARRRTLLHGGFDGTSHKGDTWTWDGAAWRQESGVGPDERTGAAAVYDVARDRVVLFGGVRTNGSTVSVRSDTWEWDGAWTQRVVSGPPGRHLHAMAYDATRGRVVLFGGSSASGMLDDTWEWDGSSWHEVPVMGEKPVARLGHGLAFDARRGRVVLFGGVLSPGGPSDETWEWDGTSWTRIDYEQRPSARYGVGMAYDSARRELVLHGGAGVGGALPPAEVWRLGAGGWSVEGSLGTLSRAGPSLAYDSVRRRMVLYGGATATGQPVSVTVERMAGSPVERLVPIVLDVRSGTAHFTTELSLTNRSDTALDVEFRYTAALDELLGSGTVTTGLPAGTQIVLEDTLAFLRERGLPIPGSEKSQQGGTLGLSFGCAASGGEIGVTSRTTTPTSAPHPIGSAGLAYAADDLLDTSAEPLTLYGLRVNATDRSNVAVYSTSARPVTLRIVARSGSGDGTSVTLDDGLELAPWGWRQLSLANSGLASGIVTIERVAGDGGFGAYGVVNDNATNDGSFLLPHRGGTSPADSLTVPVLVETPSFRSEFVLANSSEATAALDLEFVEALSGEVLPAGSVTVTLSAGEQRLVPEAVDFLRGLGAAIGPRGARSYAGALRVKVRGAPAGAVYAAARTASQSPGGGQFGLFTAPVLPEEAATESAVLNGLRADSKNRSNVALAHLGEADSGPLELTVQAHDGNAFGAARGEPISRTLAPGQWMQLDAFLANAGVANGWVVIRRTTGTAPWLAYGVVNDGGTPGERTGDGAYVPMTLPR